MVGQTNVLTHPPLGELTIMLNGTPTVAYDTQSHQSINITAASIGAAGVGHTHPAPPAHNHDSIYSKLNHTHSYAASNHSHTPASIGAANSTHNHTPAQAGAAPASHSHTAAQVGAAASNHGHTAAQVGAAAANHTHPATAPAAHRHTSFSDLPAGISTGRITGGCPGNYVGRYATSEGHGNFADGNYSHAEGDNCRADGIASHAGGYKSNADGNYSFAHGNNVIAYYDNNIAVGNYNGLVPDGVFIVGYGTGSSEGPGGEVSRSNVFYVNTSGDAVARGRFRANGGDYGEYFEWLDGNPNEEDRIGLFVSMSANRIAIANSSDDYIIGAISGHCSIIGNAQDGQWHNSIIKDEFGRLKTKKTESGKICITSPEYDNTKEYIPRSERPEWDVVGMFGVLTVKDDNTCQVDSYCKVTTGGIVTAATEGYRVLERVKDNIIKVLYRGN